MILFQYYCKTYKNTAKKNNDPDDNTIIVPSGSEKEILFRTGIHSYNYVFIHFYLLLNSIVHKIHIANSPSPNCLI